MSKNKGVKGTLDFIIESKETFLILPATYTDPTIFIKVYSVNMRKLIENEDIPERVKDDFILLTVKCSDLIEFDKNCFNETQTCIAKRLGISRTAVNQKIQEMVKYNLIKKYRDEDKKTFTIIINPLYFGKFTDLAYSKKVGELFENNITDTEKICEVFNAIQYSKSIEKEQKKQFKQKKAVQSEQNRILKTLEDTKDNLAQQKSIYHKLNVKLQEFLEENNLTVDDLDFRKLKETDENQDTPIDLQ